SAVALSFSQIRTLLPRSGSMLGLCAGAEIPPSKEEREDRISFFAESTCVRTITSTLGWMRSHSAELFACFTGADSTGFFISGCGCWGGFPSGLNDSLLVVKIFPQLEHFSRNGPAGIFDSSNVNS